MRDRAAALSSCQCSAGRRAAAWNTDLVSLVPYPAHIAAPDATIRGSMLGALRTALRLGTTA